MVSICRVFAADLALSDGLVRLLIDSVDGGSVGGFLSPLSPATPHALYWQGVCLHLATPGAVDCRTGW